MRRPSANGSAPPPPPAPRAPWRGLLHTRISGIRTGLIAAAAAIIVVLIFIIQDARAVNISLLGAHLRLSLAVALSPAAIAGALVMAAAGTARITQLRPIMGRSRRQPMPVSSRDDRGQHGPDITQQGQITAATRALPSRPRSVTHHSARTDRSRRAAGEAQLRVSGSTATQPVERSWAPVSGRSGRSAGCSREGTKLCLTTSC